jgi:hypothetical protein
MRNRRLTSFEVAMVEKHAVVIGLPMVGRRGGAIYTAQQIDKAFDAERAEREKREYQAMKSDGDYFTSDEFRQEVIAELMAEGATLEQATNRTRDQVRLFAEAKQLKMM